MIASSILFILMVSQSMQLWTPETSYPGYTFVAEHTDTKVKAAFDNVLVNNVLERNGFTDRDFCLIAAMGWIESRYKIWATGNAGEVGILQVIPREAHIRRMWRRLPCYADHCNYHNVREYLKAAPEHQLEAGIAELAFWRDQYQKRYKRLLWTKFPAWHFRKNGSKNPLAWKRKCNLWKGRFGNWIFVLHYNSGPRIVTWRYVRVLWKTFKKMNCYPPN